MILTSYLKDQDVISNDTPRCLLKKTEVRALYEIIGKTFGAIQQAGATLSIDRYENNIIVVLPYVTQHLEQENKQVAFWYNIASATCNNRKQITHQQIDVLVDKIEQKLKKIGEQRHKNEI